MASSLSLRILLSLSSISLISGGQVSAFILMPLDASSIRSIALSGKNLSVIYLEESFAAASSASSVIVTL